MPTQAQKIKRTPEAIIAQQKKDAARQQAGRPSRQPDGPVTANVPAVAAAAPLPTTVLPDTRTEVEKYVDEIAPSFIAGKLIKFSKEGKFVIAETGDEISADEDFVALCDETLIGWIKFVDDAPPEQHQGLLYQGFVKPARESLGNLDEDEWPEGLDGKPADPWQHQICLVLQSPTTQELFTFATSSQTGRRAVGNLLRHYDRMRRSESYPVVRLQPSGFKHKDERVGWVHVPSFAVVGLTPKNSPSVPDTSPAADMDDEIPGL